MVAPLLILTATTSLSEPMKVTDVTEKRVFAGRLGYRVLTTLTLSAPQRTVSVTLADIRHERPGQKQSPAYRIGEYLRVDGLGKAGGFTRHGWQLQRS